MVVVILSFNGRRRSLSVSTGLSNSIPGTTTPRRPKLSRLSEFRRSYSLRKKELLNPEVFCEAKVLQYKYSFCSNYYNLLYTLLGANTRGIYGAISSPNSARWGHTVRMEPYGLAKSSEDRKTYIVYTSASYNGTRAAVRE